MNWGFKTKAFKWEPNDRGRMMGEKKRKQQSGMTFVPVSRDKPIAVSLQAYPSPTKPGTYELMLRLGGYPTKESTEIAAGDLIAYVEDTLKCERVSPVKPQ